MSSEVDQRPGEEARRGVATRGEISRAGPAIEATREGHATEARREGHSTEARPRDIPTKDILNIDEAAALLGVSVKTFNKVLHSQSMPARKIGREWKFSRQALIDWVGSGRSQDFYESQGAGEDEDDRGELRDTEIKPIAPGEKPKARRTAGWHIEQDS